MPAVIGKKGKKVRLVLRPMDEFDELQGRLLHGGLSCTRLTREISKDRL